MYATKAFSMFVILLSCLVFLYTFMAAIGALLDILADVNNMTILLSNLPFVLLPLVPCITLFFSFKIYKSKNLNQKHVFFLIIFVLVLMLTVFGMLLTLSPV